MKKQILFALAPLFLSTGTFAQGVQFETGNWQSVLDKAKKENKLIYMDVYTTWCGPCKLLATQIFPQKEAGDKYNKLFVNYRIDAEKGEGLDIARKYNVTGYPTNLFIDPATQAVVYRTMGASTEVKGFTGEADVAIAERNDPMTFEKYDAAFKSGKKDRSFLRTYLEKDKRLNKNNDAVLNAYVAQLDKNHLADSEVYYLADMMQTVHNNALPVLAQHRPLLDKKYPGNKSYYEGIVSRAIYSTMEEAVNTRDESLLAVISDARNKYAPFEDEETVYWIRTQYYTKTEDSVKAFKAASEEANFLSARPLSYYDAKDKEGLGEIRESIREQLKMMKVPENKIDSLTELNLQDPSRKHSHSASTANTLNSLAWNVYEQHKGNKDMVKQALKWSEFSLQLAQPLTGEWPAYADTYAHLLYSAGRKDDAVKTQQSAVEKARAAKAEGVDDLEQTLKKMQEGTL